MESPDHIYGCYFHVNNDNLGLNFDPQKGMYTFITIKLSGRRRKEK